MAYIFKDYDDLLVTLEGQVSDLRKRADKETGRSRDMSLAHASGVSGVVTMLKDSFFEELPQDRLHIKKA